MLSIEDARARILAGLHPTDGEIVSLAAALGRVTARPVLARRDSPAQDVSAMDGYALHAQSGIVGARLPVIGAAPAGHPFAGRLESGQALRLFTGSVLPDGADAVIVQEDVTRDGATITLNAAAQSGRHIRRRGGDFRIGDTLIETGIRLGAATIGLAASADHPWLTVRRRPVVALLATGDEVVLPGEPVPDGGLTSSNSFAIAAIVEAAGGCPLILPIAADSEAAIAAAARPAAGAPTCSSRSGAPAWATTISSARHSPATASIPTSGASPCGPANRSCTVIFTSAPAPCRSSAFQATRSRH